MSNKSNDYKLTKILTFKSHKKRDFAYKIKITAELFANIKDIL